MKWCEKERWVREGERESSGLLNFLPKYNSRREGGNLFIGWSKLSPKRIKIREVEEESESMGRLNL